MPIITKPKPRTEWTDPGEVKPQLADYLKVTASNPLGVCPMYEEKYAEQFEQSRAPSPRTGISTKP